MATVCIHGRKTVYKGGSIPYHVKKTVGRCGRLCQGASIECFRARSREVKKYRIFFLFINRCVSKFTTVRRPENEKTGSHRDVSEWS